jgi:Ca2+-binding RTX toxin-like protein
VSFDDGGAAGVYIDLPAGQAVRGSEVDVLNNVFRAIGTSGDDVFIGRSLIIPDDGFYYFNNVFHGLGGDDTAIGSSGADVLYGGEGNDFLFGGGQGTDVADILHGDSGDDRLLRTQQAYGGDGNDHIESSGIEGQAWAEGGDGNDVIDIRGAYFNAFGGSGGDLVIMAGDSGEIYGGAGDDVIAGTGFNGFGYASTVAGGAGKDTAIGGIGSELFLFDDGDSIAGSRRDVIRNFDARTASDVDDYEDAFDAIDVSPIDARSSLAGDQAFVFVGLSSNPDAGQLGYYRSGGDTIVVGNTGAVRFELDTYGGVLIAGDFVL